MLPLTEWHKLRIINDLATLISTDTEEPGTYVAFYRVTMVPTHHGKQRVGQPRKKWYPTTLDNLWQTTKANFATVKYASDLKVENTRHISQQSSNMLNKALKILTNDKKPTVTNTSL